MRYIGFEQHVRGLRSEPGRIHAGANRDDQIDRELAQTCDGTLEHVGSLIENGTADQPAAFAAMPLFGLIKYFSPVARWL